MNEVTMAKWNEFRKAFATQARDEVAYLDEDEMQLCLDQFERDLNKLITEGGY